MELYGLLEISILFIFVFFLSYFFKKLSIPAIISFLIAGFIGKYLISHTHLDYLHIFKELGIILLFFFIGLEFSFERLKGLLRTFLPAVVDFFFNFVIPFFICIALGFDYIASLIIAGVIYPSSTSIVAKMLVDYKRLINPEAELLLGILIFEDIVAIVMLTLLSYIGKGEEVNLEVIGISFVKIFIILILFTVFYKFILSKISGFLDKLSDDENFIFFMLGVVLFFGSFFKLQGISEALGAFLIGVAIPQSRMSQNIEHHLSSIKELSIGIFFFFFTYEMKAETPDNLYILILLILLGLILKGISTYIGAYLYGLKKKARLRASLSFLPRGEFSVIIASMNPAFNNITIPIILITAIIGTFMFALANNVTNFVYSRTDRRKPS